MPDLRRDARSLPYRTTLPTRTNPLDPIRRDLLQVARGLRRQQTALQVLAASTLERARPLDGTLDFDPTRELAAGANTVRNDLLSDAIDTLEALASRNEDELRQEYEKRCAQVLREV